MKPTHLINAGGIILLFILASCASTKHLAYFQNISQGVNDTSEAIATAPVIPVIEPDDILMISVTGANPAAAAIFNQSSSNSTSIGFTGASTTTEDLYGRAAQYTLGYLVDKKGTINFPLLGTQNLQGLTLVQAQDTLQNRLLPYLKDPLVNIRFLNYKITVLGEVERPGTFTIPNQQVTLLQALGMAGDMTIFGKRVNVLVIREKDGKREIGRIDMNNSKSLFTSPFYYLQQNDIVYVQPSRAKLWNTDQTTVRNISIVASIISALAVVATVFRL
ncbi:MAG: sugar transporter [Chitinophagaceae bacterium]|nr:MAG: sugar transporter [Chitinophagaceae bacterium]